MLEDSGLLTDCATETVKHETKKQKGRFFGAIMVPIIASLIAPMASSLIKLKTPSMINAASEKGVMRAEKGQEGGFIHLAIHLILKAIF